MGEKKKEEFAYIPDIKNSIAINFTKYFSLNNEIYNYFNIGKKRSYVKVKDMIIDSLNNFFQIDREKYESKIFINYFKIKAEIDVSNNENKIIKIKDFENMLNSLIINNPYFNEIIDGYINKVFVPILDDKVADNTNIKEGLQFTDKHYKIICKIVTGIRVCIPLITHFYFLNYDEFRNEDYSIEEFLLSFYENIIDNFSIEVDLTHKFYKLVESRVSNTKYSDHSIWRYLENQGMDANSTTETILRKIFVDIFPKMELDKSPISFIHTVIKKQIDYTFKFDYPIKYKSMDLNQTDSEGISEFDKIEINNAKINESISVLTRVAIKNVKNHLMDEYDINISEDEFNFYKNNLKRNAFQLNIIFLFFAKYFNNYYTMYNCTNDEYITYCIIFKKIMKAEGMPDLADIVLGTVNEFKDKKKSLDKKTLTKIEESKAYNYLIDVKYDSTFINLLESNLLLHYFATIHLNDFLLVDYDRKNELNSPIKINVNIIFNELLTFISNLGIK